MYEDIFKKYKAHVEKVASLYRKTFIQDFEDVLQECYLCLIKCAKKYHTDEKSFMKILSKSVLNTCYTLYKKNKNKNEISVEDLNNSKSDLDIFLCSDTKGTRKINGLGIPLFYQDQSIIVSEETKTVINYINNDGYKNCQWRIINIKKHFSNLGWSNNKIEKCFNEIRDNL
jgi:hypothetical protein